MEIIEIRLETIDSTNTYAKRHAASFSKEALTCILAEEQTAGRGRFARKWHSPKGSNLYITFFFRLPPNTPHLISLAQVMAYSLATLLEKEGLSPQIKWPNDVQLSGKKVSGILAELVYDPLAVEVILGIGINVNMTPEEAFKIDQPATSLRIETGKAWDREAYLKKFQKQFSSDLETFKKQGFAPFHKRFEELLAYKGQTIRCFDGKQDWVGVCHSITFDGQLNLLLPNREIHTIVSGEISGSIQTNARD